MQDFNNWLQEKMDNIVESTCDYTEANELIRTPRPGDIVLSQASAVFKPYQDRQGNWIQPKSRRDLYKTKTPMYIISGPPDADNRYPAFVFSSSGRRNKKNIYISFEDLNDITSAYPEEEQQGKKIWLWLKPNIVNAQKYKNIHNQWSNPNPNPYLQVTHYNPNERFWKKNKDSKVYESLPEE